MGLGVIGRGLDVPGTVPGFLEQRQENPLPANTGNLKFDTTGKDPILLVPQPSDDPRDPLNLPQWRRDVNLLVLCTVGVLSVCLSSILAPDSVSLLTEFPGIKVQDAADATAYHSLANGLGGFVWVSSARVWGKRHAYLGGLLVIIASSAWGGAATSYGSFMGARILQGIGAAPYEALINATITDLFFVHERGWRMALSSLCLYGGAYLTPIISGVISERYSVKWTFSLVAIVGAAFFPFLFVFCFETAFVRAQSRSNLVRPPLLSPPSSSDSDLENVEKAGPDKAVEDLQIPSSPPAGLVSEPLPAWSFWRSLHVFSGRKSNENYFKILLRPLPLFLNPAILWACLTQAVMIAWAIFIGVALAVIFVFPPTSFGPIQIGYLYGGGIVGAFVAFVLCGLVQDPMAIFLTKKNRGVFEPEFRIPVLSVLQVLFGATGLYGFGYTASNVYKFGWLIPDVFFAFQITAVVLGGTLSNMYIAEAFGSLAIEGFTCLLVFKNLFTFGIVSQAIDWLLENGTTRMLVIAGSVQIAIGALSIPMYMFGKKNRALQARLDILGKLRLK